MSGRQAMSGRRAGFTMLEALLASSLLVMVMLGALSAVGAGSTYMDQEGTLVTLENRAQTALARVERDLKEASAATLTVAANRATFRPCTGWGLPTPESPRKEMLLGPEVSYEIPAGTRRLVRRAGGQETLLTDRAREITLSPSGRRVAVKIVLEHAGRTRTLRRELQTSVWVANP